MEQDRLPCAGPNQGPCVSDQETFERVWRKVMPEPRPDCPFTLYGDEEPEVLTPPAVAPAVPAPVAAPSPVPSCQEAASLEEPFCLGESSAAYGADLQAFIADEVADWKLYQALSRKVSGTPARTLRAMADDEYRHAKRLAAAYFLISGVRYWPDQVPNAPADTFLGALRARFSTEQAGGRSYRAAADRTSDQCLRELYLELAGDEDAHVWLIRGLVEQL